MTLTQSRVIECHAPVSGLAFLLDETLVATLGDGSVRLMRPDGESAIVKPHSAGSAILTLRIDLDGNAILTGSDDGRLARTDSMGHTTTLVEFPGHRIDALAVSRASGLRAVGVGRQVRLLNGAARLLASSAAHVYTVRDLAFNAHGNRLAAAHYNGATIWRANESDLGRHAVRLQWSGSHVRITWSPDETTVLTSTQENEVHGWQLSDHEDLRMQRYPTPIHSLEWLMKPMTLLTSGADRVIGWHFSEGGPMARPPLQLGTRNGRIVSRVAVDPTQPRIAAGYDDGHVIVSSLVGDELIRAPADAHGSVEALAWSNKGTRFAAGTRYGQITIYQT